jgi:hypothetical protein
VELVFEYQILEMFNMYQTERKILFYVVVCNSYESSKYSNTTLNYPHFISTNTKESVINDVVESGPIIT